MINELKKRMAILLPVLLVLGCGQTTPPDFDADRAWSELIYQCDLGPRVPGSAARDSAAAHIARVLKGYGGEVSLQQFEVDDPYGSGKLRFC